MSGASQHINPDWMIQQRRLRELALARSRAAIAPAICVPALRLLPWSYPASVERVDSDDRCRALWPCLEQRKGPLRIIGSPLPGWATVYLGPLFATEADIPRALQAFMSDPLLGHAAYTCCKVVGSEREVDLRPFGFRKDQGYETYLLDLHPSEDQLWSNLKGPCRRAVRKARKSGLVVRNERGPEFLDEFWEMSLEVYARSDMLPTYSRRLLSRVQVRFDFVSVYGGHGRFKSSFGPEARRFATHWERSRSRPIQWAKQLYRMWARWRLKI